MFVPCCSRISCSTGCVRSRVEQQHSGCAGHLSAFHGFPSLPLHLCCGRCLCRLIESKFRQNQFADPSCSRTVQMCLCLYRKEIVQGNERQGHEQLGILLALVFGLFCPRAYVELLTWLFPASQIHSCCWGAADGV